MTPATVSNIKRALTDARKCKVRHHIVGTIEVRDAKLLGFGTRKVMIEFADSGGWTIIDPLTWEVVR